MTREELTALEAMIDKHGLRNVAQALSDIAAAKAEHLRYNWQDSRLAREWDKASNGFDVVARRISI
jgi:hypothetical protein